MWKHDHSSWLIASIFLMICAGCPEPSSSSKATPGVNGGQVGKTAESTTSASQSNGKSTSNTLIQFRTHQLDGFAFQHGMEAEQYTAVEVVGGGVGLADYDRDGRLDMIFAGGGAISKEKELSGRSLGLFRQIAKRQFVNATSESGLSTPSFYNEGILITDFDNDGFEDCVVSGYMGLMLFHNLGDGTFVEKVGVFPELPPRWTVSTAALDVNQDGFIDLYCANYLDWSINNDPPCSQPDGRRESCGPGLLKGETDWLLINNGSGQFAERGKQFGLLDGGNGLGVLAADIDQDGDTDVYVANDATPNFFYRNQEGKKLIEEAASAGTAMGNDGNPTGSMGIAVADFDKDGRLDLWVTNYEDELFELYQNRDGRLFNSMSRRLGLELVGRKLVGWGTTFADFDADGDDDIVAATGHVERHSAKSPFHQVPLLLENLNGKRLERRQSESGEYFGEASGGRGLARGDFDADGDVDLAIESLDAPSIWLENSSPTKGSWLQLELIGTKSNREGIGATVVVEVAGKRWIKPIQRSGSFASTHSSEAHFGFPPCAKIDKLEVRWPSGVTSTIESFPSNQKLVVVESEGIVK